MWLGEPHAVDGLNGPAEPAAGRARAVPDRAQAARSAPSRAVDGPTPHESTGSAACRPAPHGRSLDAARCGRTRASPRHGSRPGYGQPTCSKQPRRQAPRTRARAPRHAFRCPYRNPEKPRPSHEEVWTLRNVAKSSASICWTPTNTPPRRTAKASVQDSGDQRAAATRSTAQTHAGTPPRSGRSTDSETASTPDRGSPPRQAQRARRDQRRPPVEARAGAW